MHDQTLVDEATRLDLTDASFDGAVTRYSLHHIPSPTRVVAEMARVVRPRGWVVVSDAVAERRADLANWHGEIERLRDPSHWFTLTLEAHRELGPRAALELVDERLQPVNLDYEDWLIRGSGGDANRELIESLFAARRQGSPTFRRD